MGGGGDNWTTGAISRAKLQSNHHHQQTPTSSFFTGRMPFLSPNQVRWLGLRVGGRLVLFYIHQMNRMNFRNDLVVTMTAL